MNKLGRLLLIGLLGTGLSGCLTTFTSTALLGLEGNGHCPPELKQTAHQVAYDLETIPPGMHVSMLPPSLKMPEEKTKITLQRGEELDLWLYRTGHKNCRALPTAKAYSPLVLQNGYVWGGGTAYYNQYISPWIVGSASLDAQNNSWFNNMFYPLNKVF